MQELNSSRFNISSLSVNHPIGTMSMAVMLVILGMLFWGRLPLGLLPQVEYPHIRIVVNYPGVTPEVIEEQLTRVLEKNLSATENLVEIHGRASEGRTYIEMFFEVGTDIDLALQDAARQLERARAELPPGIDPPRLMKMDPSQTAIYELAISSTHLSSIDLRQWVDQRLVPQILSVKGTGTIEVAGGKLREIDVVADPERMRSYGLNLTHITQALAQRNVDIAAGYLTSQEYDILARTESRFRDARQISEFLIPLPNSNQWIPLSDIATVTDSHREQRLFARHNGHEAIQLSIMKQPDANTVQVIRDLEQRIGELQESGFIPSYIDMDPIRDESFFIVAAIRSVATAAGLGGLLAMLVVLFFLGSVRQSVIIAISLPLAIIGAFLLMGASGLSLNVLSLGGLALGIGLLLDNGLVVLENIHHQRNISGHNTIESIHKGTQKVQGAVIAGTVTNLAAVAPFLLLSGLAALIFRELILTISFSILTSLILALTLVPTLVRLFLTTETPDNPKPAAVFRLFQAGFERIRSYYRKKMPYLLQKRWWVLSVSLVMLVFSIFVLRQRGTEFLPPVDDGRITMRFVLPLGTAPEPTHQVAALIEEQVYEMPHVKTVYSTAGGYFRGGQLSLRGGMIDMVVQLEDLADRRGYSAEQWVDAFADKMDALGIFFEQQRIRGPRLEGLRTSMIDDDISIGIVGNELDVLDEAVREVMQVVASLPGVASAQIGRDERIPQVLIKLDEKRASDRGINVADAGQIIHAAVDGAVPTYFVSDGFEYPIRVRFPRDITGSVSQLGNIPLFNVLGEPTLLGNVAAFQTTLGPAHIERLNQVRIMRVNVTANPQMTSVGELDQNIRNILKDYQLPEGYSFVFGGAANQIRESNRALMLAIVLAAVFVFLVLAIQYEQIKSPLVIMSALPFSVIGATMMLWISGIHLSAPVLLGFIFLVGIVVNNAILLIDFADRNRIRHGYTATEAIVQAGYDRFRPVMMTSLTTILGMLPLALRLGEGAELMQPLAITVIGGLAVGTLLTLVALPVLYVLFYREK